MSSTHRQQQPSPPPPPHPPPSTDDTWACAECGTNSTPVRRGGPDGPATLCNACGLRLAKRNRGAVRSRKRSATNARLPQRPPKNPPSLRHPPAPQPLPVPPHHSLSSVNPTHHPPHVPTSTPSPFVNNPDCVSMPQHSVDDNRRVLKENNTSPITTAIVKEEGNTAESHHLMQSSTSAVRVARETHAPRDVNTAQDAQTTQETLIAQNTRARGEALTREARAAREAQRRATEASRAEEVARAQERSAEVARATAAAQGRAAEVARMAAAQDGAVNAARAAEAARAADAAIAAATQNVYRRQAMFGDIGMMGNGHNDGLFEVQRGGIFVAGDVFDGMNECVPTESDVGAAAKAAAESSIVAAVEATHAGISSRIGVNSTGQDFSDNRFVLESIDAGRENNHETNMTGYSNQAVEAGRMIDAMASSNGFGGGQAEGDVVSVAQHQLSPVNMKEADADAIRANAPRLVQDLEDRLSNQTETLQRLATAAAMLEERSQAVRVQMRHTQQEVANLTNDVARIRGVLYRSA